MARRSLLQAALGHAAPCLGTVQATDYVRRQPEHTALYALVSRYWPAFREHTEELGGLPEFVVTEFEEYLKCGILEHGCLHLECRQCGHSQLVAFSCKLRGICPSCITRRMADAAVHLEQRVFPTVPVRHWICSLPWGLRALLGYDRELAAEAVTAFVQELSRSLRHRAKAMLGLRSVSQAHTGAVAAVQRTDGALRLNVHFHVLALDGVHVEDPVTGELVFHELATPTADEVAEVAARTAERLKKILAAHGRSLDPEMVSEPPALQQDEPGLASCYAAATQGIAVTGDRAGQPTLRLLSSQTPNKKPTHPDVPAAEVCGINLYAKQIVRGRDRKQLERLCRYITRPPVANDRIHERENGRFELTLKSVWKDGTRALVFEPFELLTRLVAAVPPPRFHLLRYYGVLSSHHKHRAKVVPEPPPQSDQTRPPPAPGDQLALDWEPGADPEPRPGRKRWAWLLRHVFAADLETCPKCGGPQRFREVATKTDDITRLLAAHGLGPAPPAVPERPPREQLTLPFI